MLTPDPLAQIKDILQTLDAEELSKLLAKLNLQFAPGQTREQMAAQFQEAFVEALLSGKLPQIAVQVEQTASFMDSDVLAERLLAELNLQLTPEEASDLREQVAEHFSDTMMETMLSNMNDEQFEEFKAVLRADPEQVDMGVAAITARIPGLYTVLVKRLTEEYEGLKIALRS